MFCIVFLLLVAFEAFADKDGTLVVKVLNCKGLKAV
jgi:hypothetical protein